MGHHANLEGKQRNHQPLKATLTLSVSAKAKNYYKINKVLNIIELYILEQ